MKKKKSTFPTCWYAVKLMKADLLWICVLYDPNLPPAVTMAGHRQQLEKINMCCW